MSETIERLAARLDLNALAKDYGKKTSEKDYVYVDGENMQTPPSTSGSEGYEPYSETVNIASAERWEKELMEDPKVRNESARASPDLYTHQANCLQSRSQLHRRLLSPNVTCIIFR